MAGQIVSKQRRDRQEAAFGRSGACSCLAASLQSEVAVQGEPRLLVVRWDLPSKKINGSPNNFIADREFVTINLTFGGGLPEPAYANRS
jgi:hypothetical protein